MAVTPLSLEAPLALVYLPASLTPSEGDPNLVELLSAPGTACAVVILTPAGLPELIPTWQLMVEQLAQGHRVRSGL